MITKNGVLNYKLNKDYFDKFLTRDFLYEQRFIYKKTIPQISKEYKISINVITKKIKEFGLCIKKHRINLSKNDVFGKLTLIQLLPYRKNNALVWKCSCECGKIAAVTQGNLCNGSTQSCGCIRQDLSKWWIYKYGKNIGSKMINDLNQKFSKPGNKNPMYGKPPSNKVGSGYKGTYKGTFFRSLLELSYIIDYLEKNNIKWVSCEEIQFKIPYETENGINKTYTPDFLINDNIIIEIKPKSRMKSLSVALKAKIAQEYCDKHNMVYNMIDFPYTSVDKIKQLEDLGYIVFSVKTKAKIQKYYDRLF